MQNKRIEKYSFMAKQFFPNPEDEGIATDALINACNSRTFPIKRNEAEAFIYESMKNAVSNERRKESKNMSQHNVIKTVDGKKKDFEQFYSAWLGDQGMTDSVANRQAGENAWHELSIGRFQPQEVELDAPVYIGSELGVDERTLIDFIASDSPTPEEAFFATEEVELLRKLPGMKNRIVRDWLIAFLPKEEDSSPADLKHAYKVALLNLAKRVGWKEQESGIRVRDIHYICQLIGVATYKFTQIEPAEAEAKLSQLHKIGTPSRRRKAHAADTN